MVKNSLQKITNVLLTITLLYSSFTPVFAEENKITNGKSKVKLTAQATKFDVTIPLGLPVHLHSDGSVEVAKNTQIVNNSIGPVIVTDVRLKPSDNWELASFTDNYNKKKVDSKELGFKLMNENVNLDGSVDLQNANWPVINGKSKIPLTYDVKVPAQSENKDNIEMAQLALTLKWDMDNTDKKNSVKVNDLVKVNMEQIGKIGAFDEKNDIIDDNNVTINIPANSNVTGEVRSKQPMTYGSYSADIIVPDNDSLLNGFLNSGINCL